jgi:hypothetical protein
LFGGSTAQELSSRSQQTALLLFVYYLSGFVANVCNVTFQSLGGLTAEQQKYHNN